MITYEQAREKLAAAGQEHALQYWDELTKEEREALLSQIGALDFSMIHYVKDRDELPARGKITPLGAMELSEIEEKKEHFKELGLAAIRQGKVAAVLLAGGMGTRLGSDNPKCMYDIGITHPVFIMQRLIENTMDVVREAGCFIPFYIMTSEKNHDATVSFMKEHNYFGYDPEKIRAVDNVLQRIADPVFVGAVLDRKAASGAKVVRKVSPDEKVGAMCLEDGKPSIVEYYDMTPELLSAKNEKGDPAYNFGVILNYLFREADLEKVMNEKLMLHIVEKKIPYMAPDGTHVKPEKPNGYKFEQLILDMVHEMDSCLPFEVDREKEFAPIKNRTGIDSVESARALCGKCGIVL